MITEMPLPMPVTTPEVPTMALAGILLDHVPPEVASLKDVVDPTQTVGVPVIMAGSALTVITADAEQPAPIA